MISIRRRLLISLLIGLLASTALMMCVAYTDTTNEIGELFSNNLRRIALVLRGQAFPDASFQPAPAGSGFEEIEESYIIQLWDAGGELLRSSNSGVDIHLEAHEGQSHQSINGVDWQIYMLKAADAGFVQVAQPDQIVSTMVGESAIRVLLPLLGLFVVLSAGAWHAVGRSLRPLASLSQSISGWEADTMRPLPITQAPTEIQPVVSALNGLLIRLDKAISLQRQFTADAAHELRTPLTAIKLQLENLVRATSEQDRQDAVEKLSGGIDRCIHLASQLLVSSRSMAIKTTPEFQTVRLQELVRSSLASFVIVASSKNIEISFYCDAECRLRGDEEGLRVLVNNLIDNAIRYTPEMGTVTVRLSEEGGQVSIAVSDSGPGIPKAEHEKIFQRFYRIPGTVSTGSGLGLSIVKSVVESHNATLAVMDGPHQKGTTFRIVFPVQEST